MPSTMSATPQSARAGWGSPQVLPPPAPPRPKALEGHDRLQVLLAFARMHEQAVARRCQHHSSTPEIAPDEYFGLDEVLRLVAARAGAITGADGIAVGLVSEDAIVCRTSFGRISPDPGVRLDPHSGFSGACLRHGQTVRCDDSETDSRVNPQACRSLGARSMVAVPLTTKGCVVGLLEAFSSEPLGFNESGVGSLNLLGELILAAMHPAEEDRLVQLAGQILPEPRQPEPERPGEAGGTFTEEGASAPAAVDSDLAGPPITEALVAPILDEAEAEASTPPSQSSRIAKDMPIPARAAGASKPPPQTEPTPAPVFLFPEEQHSYSGLALLAGLVLVAVGLSWAWIHHAEPLTTPITTRSTPFNPPRKDSREPDFPEQPVPKPGTTPAVTRVRHRSSADSSTVVIEIEDQVQYETHTLDKPPRIYFDLFDTKMAPGLLNQGITVDDDFIKRIRIAQSSNGTTRVVLDTVGITEASVKVNSNPYRLTIDVHKPRAIFPSIDQALTGDYGFAKKTSRVASSASIRISDGAR